MVISKHSRPWVFDRERTSTALSPPFSIFKISNIYLLKIFLENPYEGRRGVSDAPPLLSPPFFIFRKFQKYMLKKYI